jgi:hypothetical protein
LCGIIGHGDEQRPTSMLQDSNLYAVYVRATKEKNIIEPSPFSSPSYSTVQSIFPTKK